MVKQRYKGFLIEDCGLRIADLKSNIMLWESAVTKKTGIHNRKKASDPKILKIYTFTA